MTTEHLLNGCFLNGFDNWVNDGYWVVSDKDGNPDCGGGDFAAKLGPAKFFGTGIPGVEGVLYQVVNNVPTDTDIFTELLLVFVRGNYFKVEIYGIEGETETLLATPVNWTTQMTNRNEWETILGGFHNTIYTTLKYVVKGRFPTSNSIGMKFNSVRLFTIQNVSRNNTI